MTVVACGRIPVSSGIPSLRPLNLAPRQSRRPWAWACAGCWFAKQVVAQIHDCGLGVEKEDSSFVEGFGSGRSAEAWWNGPTSDGRRRERGGFERWDGVTDDYVVEGNYL